MESPQTRIKMIDVVVKNERVIMKRRLLYQYKIPHGIVVWQGGALQGWTNRPGNLQEPSSQFRDNLQPGNLRRGFPVSRKVMPE